VGNSNHALRCEFSSLLILEKSVATVDFQSGFENGTLRVGVKGAGLPLCYAATYLYNWRENVSVCVVEGKKKLLAPCGVMNDWTMARITAPSGVSAINIALRLFETVACAFCVPAPVTKH
jgi:hypothetical protein